MAYGMQVKASMDGTNKVTIGEIILRTNTGKTINLGNGNGSNWGGGGEGSGGGGSGSSGRVIDVEAKVQ